MTRSMNDLTDWHKITCQERDAIISVNGEYDDTLFAFSSLTDTRGEFGEPLVYTEWGRYNPDRAVLRDYLWPDDDGRECEHWVPDCGEEVQVVDD